MQVWIAYLGSVPLSLILLVPKFNLGTSSVNLVRFHTAILPKAKLSPNPAFLLYKYRVLDYPYLRMASDPTPRPPA